MLSLGYNTKVLLWLFAAIRFITGQSSTCGPPTPPYGSTIVHPPKQEKHNNGGVVLFGCKQGFYLVGSPLITCTGNTWTQIKFRCLGFCPELRSILNGKVVHAIPKFGKAAVEFQCNKNHRLIGIPRLECIKGRWNGILPFCEKLKSCVRLRPPANGTLHWNDTSHGAKASFACLTGFDLFGSSILTCNNGAWSTSVPTCKAYCANIRDPFNGRKHGTRFSHGRVVSFECKFGYKLVGSLALRCIDGRWNSSAPVCNAMLCPKPTIPSNSYIIYPGTNKDSYVHGIKLFLACRDGYYLTGLPIMECNQTVWLTTKFSCIASCPVLGTLKNGIITHITLRDGGEVEIKCLTNHTLDGSSKLICRNGRWNDSLPSCGAPCEEPATPMHGWKLGRDFRHGRSVRFFCITGHHRVGASSITCNDGTWDNQTPSCKAQCNEPGSPIHGRKIGDVFRHHSWVQFLCDSNFKLDGDEWIQCIDGSWSASVPKCIGLAPCDEPARPAHGGKWGRDFKHGRSVRFSCSRGYQRIGASSITCNDGTWNNNVPVCKGICGRPRTPSNGQLHGNSFLDGDEVRFSCNSNHDLFGNTRLRCVDRAWTSPAPECKARCTYQGRPRNGYYHKGGMARGDKIKHGVQITYSCFRSYTLVGAKMQECNNGRWTNNTPLCKASCHEPANPAHGRRGDRDFKHGRSVRFYCFGGYRMIGASSITCNDGTWDNKVPVCKGFCGRPRTPSKGRIHGNSFLDGDEVTFSCDRNHDLFGNAKLRCVDRVWDSPVPECKGRCDFKGIPQNGYSPNQRFSRNDNLKHYSSVEYACDSRYTLTGSKVLHCNDGRWNASVPSCKASCNDPGLLSNGQRNGNDYSHGQTVTYQCRQGYSLEGSHQRTCDDGKWDSVPPECKASCSPQQAPHNGKMHNNNSAHRALVSFSCNDGFLLSGSRQIKCSDGKWNDSTPTCKENIALLKPTSQSSTAIHGRPLKSSFAVDGKKNTHYSHCTHTDDSTSTNPWWRVDLGRVEHVTEVNILNRGDCCGHRLDGAEIRVGNEITNGGATNHLCAANIQVPQGKSKTFLCRPKAYGRYVSIRIPGKKKYLMLCEVEVYSSDSSSCKNPGQLRNGKIIGDDYTNGSTVEFQCHRHYRLNGSRFLSCVKGKWNASIPKCWKNCQEPEKPQDGWKLGNNFGHGGVLKFWCKNKTYKLIGASQITCNDGNWSDPIPSCEECGRSLVMENSNIQNFRITSPDSTDPRHAPNHARLNGPSSWCTSSQTYLQIDLGRIYKVTAIATQGGADFDKWVKRYKIGFYAGATAVFYSESGQLQKTIEGNKDASSIVKYQFKEPFVTRNVRIYPNVDPTSTVCLRTEIYGCDPKPDCILVGSMFWGLWSQRDNSNNYYKAYITRIDDTHFDFALEVYSGLERSYNRTDPVLIVDKISEMKDISLKASVIAVHKDGRAEWYRTGIVNGISGPSVSVLFDDHQQRWVQLNELRLVKRPKFCMSSI